MRITDEDYYINVQIEDAKFVFRDFEYFDEFLAKQEGENENYNPMNRLVRIENFQDKDGSDVTPEGIRKIKIPTRMAARIIKGFWEEANKVWSARSGTGAEQKNETTNSSAS